MKNRHPKKIITLRLVFDSASHQTCSFWTYPIHLRLLLQKQNQPRPRQSLRLRPSHDNPQNWFPLLILSRISCNHLCIFMIIRCLQYYYYYHVDRYYIYKYHIYNHEHVSTLTSSNICKPFSIAEVSAPPICCHMALCSSAAKGGGSNNECKQLDKYIPILMASKMGRL